MDKDDADLSNNLRKIEESIEELKTEQHNFRKTIASHSLVVIIIIAIIAIILGFTVYQNDEIKNDSAPKSNFIIENLSGDIIDTWGHWVFTEYQDLHIHLLNSPAVTNERIQIIRDVVMSNKTIEIDDSLLHKGIKGSTSVYYLGWKGALDSIKNPTKETIPKNLHFDVVKSEQGDVIIKLTNEKNADGFLAFTKSIIDESNHAILKSTITIYEIESLSNERLATIMRHELGHALGLAHSTAPEDLMAPIITTPYPYISPCDIDAILSLYDGNQRSQVVCEK